MLYEKKIRFKVKRYGQRSFFDNLVDPRVERTKLHTLKDIFITICAVLSGCNEFRQNNIYLAFCC